MEASIFQSALRIFYRYQTSQILCLDDGKILGLVKKDVLEEKMSDLSYLKSGQSLPIKTVEVDEILTVINGSNIIENGSKSIPAIDKKGVLLALMTKTDILKLNHSAETALNESLSENSSDRDEIYKMPEFPRPDIRPDIKVKMDQDLNVSSRENSPPDRGNVRTTMDSAEFITIKTLESLPIPMLAVDTRGEVLFYNQDWVELQRENKETLGIKNLMRNGKDIMAKLAFEGKLEVTSVLEVPVSLKNQMIKLRAILNDDGSRPEVIGYIFWAESVIEKIVEKKADPIPEKKPEKKDKKNSADSGAEANDHKKYYGKTLVELLRDEEKKILDWAMKEAGGNQSNAAMLLGIPRQTFSFRYNKIKKNKMSNKLK